MRNNPTTKRFDVVDLRLEGLGSKRFASNILKENTKKGIEI